MPRFLAIFVIVLATLSAQLWAKRSNSSAMSRPKTSKPRTSHPATSHTPTVKPHSYKPKTTHAPTYRPKTSKPAPAKRSSTPRSAFRRENPCPSTGQKSGACPGYVIDHRVALKRGGPDSPENMQWQTAEAAKAKDRVE